jgi:hypothetical protein
MSVTGNSGHMTIAGAAIDVTEWTFDAQIPEIDSTLLNGAHYECKAGRPKVTFQATIRWDANSQTALDSRFTGATPSGASAAVVLYTGASTSYSGSAIITGVGATTKKDGLIEQPVSGTFTGAITVA